MRFNYGYFDSKMFMLSKQRFYRITLIVCIAIICLQTRVNAQKPALKILSQASNPSSTQTVSLEDRVRQLDERLRKVEGKPKDFWDKLSAASGLISGGLIAGIGILATNAYKRREIKISEVQTIQGFMPYLTSGKPQDVRTALRAISILGNEQLSIALTLEYPEEISIPSLAKMASSSNPTEAVQGEKTLENLFQRTYPSISAIRQEFLKLAYEYQTIRKTMPAGRERTSKMEFILQRMKDTAQEMKEQSHPILPLLQEFTNRTSVAAQLAAISMLQVEPNIDYLNWLAVNIAADPGSFHGYQAAKALSKAAQVFGKQQREAVQEAINLARRLASESTKGADAFRELNKAYSGLQGVAE